MCADWTSRQCEQYSLAYISMYNTLAECALRVGNYDATIHWANHILTENRCDEAAYRQLMQAYAAQGRRSEALRQFQRCERFLHEELGVSPMPETTHVYRAILANTV
jgi:LuxR family maltose regulon positive regulatory protein